MKRKKKRNDQKIKENTNKVFSWRVFFLEKIMIFHGISWDFM